MSNHRIRIEYAVLESHEFACIRARNRVKIALKMLGADCGDEK